MCEIFGPRKIIPTKHLHLCEINNINIIIRMLKYNM